MVEDWPHASRSPDPDIRRLRDTGPYGAPSNPGLFFAVVMRAFLKGAVSLLRAIRSRTRGGG